MKIISKNKNRYKFIIVCGGSIACLYIKGLKKIEASKKYSKR